MKQKHARISQYHEEARALHTETVINDTCNFDVGTRLKNLKDLRSVDFTANRHLPCLKRVSPDRAIAAERFGQYDQSRIVTGQRTSAQLRCVRSLMEASLAATALQSLFFGHRSI